MQILSDYHTHTTYSHGTGSILDSAKEAKKKGLTEIAITDHCFSHMFCGLKRKDLKQMREDIALAEKETGIKIYLGVESNIVNYKGKIGVSKEDYKNIDILLCGFHLIVKMNPLNFLKSTVLNCWYKLIHKNYYSENFNLNKRFIKRNTKAVINALRNNDIDILTHPSRNVRINELEVAKVCVETDTAFEINAKSGHLTEDQLTAIAKTGVKFIIDSDAHCKEAVGDMSRVLALVEKVISPDQILNANGKVFVPKKFRNKKLKS